MYFHNGDYMSAFKSISIFFLDQFEVDYLPIAGYLQSCLQAAFSISGFSPLQWKVFACSQSG